METAVASIISVALLVLGGMMMSQGFLSSVDKTSVSLGSGSDLAKEIARTDLTSLSASNPVPGTTLEVSLRNSGQTKLASFSQWDVIVQYTDTSSVYRIIWLPYVASTPGNNQWTVKGIYRTAASETPEVFEPNILNPGEEMKVRAILSPAAKNNSNNMAIVSTENGVTATTAFVGQQ